MLRLSNLRIAIPTSDYNESFFDRSSISTSEFIVNWIDDETVIELPDLEHYISIQAGVSPYFSSIELFILDVLARFRSAGLARHSLLKARVDSIGIGFAVENYAGLDPSHLGVASHQSIIPNSEPEVDWCHRSDYGDYSIEVRSCRVDGDEYALYSFRAVMHQLHNLTLQDILSPDMFQSLSLNARELLRKEMEQVFEGANGQFRDAVFDALDSPLMVQSTKVLRDGMRRVRPNNPPRLVGRAVRRQLSLDIRQRLLEAFWQDAPDPYPDDRSEEEVTVVEEVSFK
jgi:hypothetical protein